MPSQRNLRQAEGTIDQPSERFTATDLIVQLDHQEREIRKHLHRHLKGNFLAAMNSSQKSRKTFHM